MSNATEGFPPYIQFIVDHPGQTLGAWMAGGIGDLVLQGAIIIQTGSYFMRYLGDSWRLKWLVGVVAFLNVLKSLQTCAIMWDKFVDSFGNYIAVSSTTWYAGLENMTSEIISLICQCYFVMRLYRIVGNMWIALLVISPFLLAGFAGNVALTVLVFNTSKFYSQTAFNATATTGLVGIMGSDVLVTAMTSFYLLRSKTGFRRTDGLITRLLRLTWMSAAFPAICALLNLVFYLVLSPKGNGWFIAFNLWLPKLYTISMMYTLLARQSLNDVDDAYVLSSKARATTGVTGVHVATTTSVHFTDGRTPAPIDLFSEGGKGMEDSSFHSHSQQYAE